MSRRSWTSRSASSGGPCLLLGLSLVLGSFFLVQTNMSVGTEPGDIQAIAGDFDVDPATSVAAAAPGMDGPNPFGLHEGLAERSSEIRAPVRRWLIGILERGPPF